MKLAWTLILATTALAAPRPQGGAPQIAFVPPAPSAPAASERLAPLSSAGPSVSASVQGDELFITHSSFSDHRIRLKNPSKLGCDAEQESQSGYLDTPRGHYYFWWFRRPNKPLATWFNGGPGCSSFCGLLQELGPCRIAGNGTSTVPNPYTWAEAASFMFIDQPVGVGLSYTDRANDTGEWSTPQAAESMLAFYVILFSAFRSSWLEGTDLHLAGESFGGRYLPHFADRIVKHNLQALADESIPLKSVMIGNGNTDPVSQYESFYPVGCTNASGYAPVLDKASCEQMSRTLPRCVELLRQCYDLGTPIACSTANTYCEETQTSAYYKTGRSPYDLYHFGDYKEDAWIEHYLNIDEVRKELGVDPGVGRYFSCSDGVGENFSATGDQVRPSTKEIANLLEHGVGVLIYEGDRDWICNWIGNERWTLALDWSGKKAFNAQQRLKPWFAKGSASPAGFYRSASNLTFATVAQSGHFVPYDQPVAALAMARAWLLDGHLASLQ